MQSCQIMKTTMTTALLHTLNPSPPKTIICKLKVRIEWAMKMKKGKLKEWTLKLKEWTQIMNEWTKKSYILREKGIA